MCITSASSSAILSTYELPIIIKYYLMKKLHSIAFILLIVGGLNWLLEGVFAWGIGDVLPTVLERIIYILVGLSAIFLIVDHKKTCKECEKAPEAAPSAMPM
jgi:uncharacterized protein